MEWTHPEGSALGNPKKGQARGGSFYDDDVRSSALSSQTPFNYINIGGAIGMRI